MCQQEDDSLTAAACQSFFFILRELFFSLFNLFICTIKVHISNYTYSNSVYSQLVLYKVVLFLPETRLESIFIVWCIGWYRLDFE